MTETKYFRDAFRDQLHELSGQPIPRKFNLSQNIINRILSTVKVDQ